MNPVEDVSFGRKGRTYEGREDLETGATNICRDQGEHSLDTAFAGAGGETNTARSAAATGTSLWLFTNLQP